MIYSSVFIFFIIRFVHNNYTIKKRQVEESEQRFRSIIENSFDAIILLDKNGTILYESPSIVRINGYTVEERIGTNGFGRIHPDDVNRVKQSFGELTQIPGKSLSMEFSFLHKNGNYIQLKAVATNLLNEPAVKSIVVNLSDITGRKQAENTLRHKNFAFDVSIDAKSIADINGIITEANSSFLRAWGYPSMNEVIGKPISFFIEDPDAEIVILTALNNTGEWEGEYTARKKDGSTFIAHGLATVVKDETGKLLAYQSSVIDITKRKQAEEALQDSEKRFRNVLQDVKTVAVQGYGPDGTTTYWNNASELLYGFTAQEAIGNNLLDLIIPSEMKDDVSAAIKWMAETGQPIP
jgi:PAS domain S-box-containing protein